jgi:uncharacterized protein YndB with AHSA1/START domain
MPELVERIDIDAPPERVWATLTDWESQGEWMLATDVRTVGGPAQRLHGRLAARTGLPLPGGRHVGILDTMIITTWEPPRLVELGWRLVRPFAVFGIRRSLKRFAAVAARR